MKKYLKDGDRVYATGVFLIWDGENKKWVVDGFEDDTYFNGEVVENTSGKPFTEKQSQRRL